MEQIKYVEPNITEENLAALRSVLSRMRWHDQGGFSGYVGNREWSFVSTGLPQTGPDELNALMDLAGIIPDKIVSLGDCSDCFHSENGREKGYRQPCLSCKRPRMSNFESSKGKVK